MVVSNNDSGGRWKSLDGRVVQTQCRALITRVRRSRYKIPWFGLGSRQIVESLLKNLDAEVGENML